MMAKSNRGGRRPGAGRRPIPAADKMRRYTVTLPASTVRQLQQLMHHRCISWNLSAALRLAVAELLDWQRLPPDAQLGK